MGSTDVVDDVNALLKLKVGDPYRLEHIKQTYVQNKKIWITDENYLKRLREKYLVKHNSDISSEENILFENELENDDTIHCWKCGKKCPLGANFCMVCGSSLFEVGFVPQPVVETTSSKNYIKSLSLKIPILVGIPVLILIILGAVYSMAYFDNALDSSSETISTPVVEDEEIFYGVYDSRCGDGTVLDPETNTCIVGKVLNPTGSDESDSKCGLGTVFDVDTNSCILE